MKRLFISRTVGAVWTLSSMMSHAATNPLDPVTLRPSQTDFGGVGLMQMPSGRMSADGEFNIGISYNEDYTHYNASIQLFPWMEATIRYTRVPDMLYNNDPDFSGDNAYTDKGIDFKIRLLEESQWLPETSIGVRDFGGTGLFDGEFIAGTKRFGNLDVTLGMGWGYIGQSGNITNPFCKMSDKYCDRDSGYKGSGGSIDFERWFKGNAAIYGGLEYQTPYQPLRLKLEYDANDYTSDFPYTRGNKPMPQHTPWNVGVLYQLGDWGDAKVSYQRGDTLTLGFNFYTNFNHMKAIWRDEPKVTPVTHQKTTPENKNNWQSASQQLKHNAGFANNSIAVDGQTLVVTGEQTKYRDRDEAIDRAAAILTHYHDNYIQTYRIVETNNGVPLTQTDVDVKRYQQVEDNAYIGATLTDATSQHEPSHVNSAPLASNKQQWSAGLSPVLQQSLGGAEAFYLFNLGVNANADVWLTDSLQASGSIYFNIVDNYDKFNYEDNTAISNSSVPRVRTLFRSYVSDNPVRLNNLQMTWFAHPAKQVYTQVYGGYLESMFAGVGGEALYRPLNQNWALGMDINQVTQRDPDNWFGTMHNTPYYTPSSCRSGSCQAKVLEHGSTGFVSAYYMPQWHWLDNSLIKLSYGQFLAGDKGARIDISRQFKSGVTVGAYASLTDMSTEDFGEGSYNKGFYISLPLDIMTIKPSTSRAQISWQPITRDGGQMLNRKYHLFDVTDARSPWYQRKNTAH